MDLQKLFEMQRDLDLAIAKNLNMLNDFNSVETVDKRVFALKVELAEFANEVAWFKYWKQSHVMNRENTLEELADVMHFLLSAGISRRYTFIKELHPDHWEKVPLERLFCYMMENTYDSSGKWLNAFEQLLQIGFKLGYTDEEMVAAYQEKNAKNYKRQESGY